MADGRGQGASGIVGLVLLLLAHGSALSAPANPDTSNQRIASELGTRFVAGINSDQAATRVAVIRDIMAASALAGDGERKATELLGRLRERYGTLTFHHGEVIHGGVPSQPRLAFHLYARSAKDGGWKDFQFYLDPEPPHRIRNLVFIAEVAEPVYLPNGDIRSAATLAWLDRYIDQLVADNDLSGGLLIAQADSILLERSFGFADSARTRAITATTRFNLGSGGKMFTALALAQLVEAGRLRFADPLATRLPAIADQAFARHVTLAQLLAHTSGVGEYWNDDYEHHWNELRTLKDFLPYVLRAGTSFEPGTRFEYSNSNYILAGLVIEAVTGKRYEQVLADRIWGPLHMGDTGLFPFDDADPMQTQRLSRGSDGRWHPSPHGYRGSSAGGALSTARDMLRFARALVSGRIVSKATVEEMTTSKTTGLPDGPMPYGYGFALEGAGPTRSFGHGGIATGVNFELRYFPDSDITLIAFSNQDNGAYDDLRRNTTRLITGER